MTGADTKAGTAGPAVRVASWVPRSTVYAGLVEPEPAGPRPAPARKMRRGITHQHLRVNPMSVRHVALLIALAAAVGTAACQFDRDPVQPQAGAAAEVSVSLGQSRLFELSRQFRLTVTNGANVPVTIADAQLRSRLFSPVAPAGRTSTLEPSTGPRTMPLAYGPAVCQEDVPLEQAVRLTINGAPTEIPLGDAEPAIQRVQESECAAAEARRALKVTFGDGWKRIGPARAAGVIEVDTRGRPGAELEEVTGSVVFAIDVRSALPATDDIDVVVTAARCEAHALIESKKTFRFPLLVRLPDGRHVSAELEAADGSVRQALARAIDECVANREYDE